MSRNRCGASSPKPKPSETYLPPYLVSIRIVPPSLQSVPTSKCVCGEEGARLVAFENQILRVMKLSMPKAVDAWKREALGEGRVFLKLQPSLPQTAGSPEEDASIEEFWGLNSDERYFHISHMSFNPYRPMVQISSLASEVEALGAGRSGGEVALKVLNADPSFLQNT